MDLVLHEVDRSTEFRRYGLHVLQCARQHRPSSPTMQRARVAHGAPLHFLQVFHDWAARKFECPYGLGLSLLRSVVPTSGVLPAQPAVHVSVEDDIAWNSENVGTQAMPRPDARSPQRKAKTRVSGPGKPLQVQRVYVQPRSNAAANADRLQRAISSASSTSHRLSKRSVEVLRAEELLARIGELLQGDNSGS